MYDAYSKWIRSHKDLPLRLNQWNNVVRWEFQHPVPFLRSREFLWQEGHTVFARQEEAVLEARRILSFYERVFKELYALPILAGRKAESEKFAGADFSLSLEVVLPNGKAAQGATSHHLGQNFSKAFNISFLDENQQQQYGWQNSWGISTRSIGLMVMTHGDDKGLVLPPKIAPLQVVIIPILFDDSKAKVLKEAHALKEKLLKTGLSVYLDDRDGYTPGWKFHEWEVKGVPVRVELGPKDMEKKQVMVARRDTGEKKAVSLAEVEKNVLALLREIQDNLYRLAEKKMKESISLVASWNEAEKQLAAGKVLLAPWCAEEKCELAIKEKSGGAKSLNAPFKEQQPALKTLTTLKKGPSCFACTKAAKEWFYLGKSY
jgi:prolyl-tRNA synthetase